MVRILSVDDSMMVRNLIKKTLEKEGFEVLIANDGVDAMAIARTENVDLVLSDVNMPNMDGINLVSELRLLDGYLNVPIIMLTTEDSDIKKSEAKGCGATGWLQKPFTPDGLLGIVKKVLA